MGAFEKKGNVGLSYQKDFLSRSLKKNSNFFHYAEYFISMQPKCRDSGNKFGRISVPLLEGRISYINLKRHDGGDTNKN